MSLKAHDFVAELGIKNYGIVATDARNGYQGWGRFRVGIYADVVANQEVVKSRVTVPYVL